MKKKRWNYITVLVSDEGYFDEHGVPIQYRPRIFKDIPETIETELSLNLTWWGEKGWRLISFQPHSEHLYLCVFKRRVK